MSFTPIHWFFSLCCLLGVTFIFYFTALFFISDEGLFMLQKIKMNESKLKLHLQKIAYLQEDLQKTLKNFEEGGEDVAVYLNELGYFQENTQILTSMELLSSFENSSQAAAPMYDFYAIGEQMNLELKNTYSEGFFRVFFWIVLAFNTLLFFLFWLFASVWRLVGASVIPVQKLPIETVQKEVFDPFHSKESILEASYLEIS